MYSCFYCGKVFSYNRNLKRHQQYSCKKEKVAKRSAAGVFLEENPHKKLKNSFTSDEGVFILEHAFKHRIVTYRIYGSGIDVKKFFQAIVEKIVSVIRDALTAFPNLKINLILYGLYELPSKNTQDVKSFNTRNRIITSSDNLNEVVYEFMCILDKKASEFQERDSGWTLLNLLYVDVNINKNTPLKGSSYIPLPKNIELKKAVLNIKNFDQECFKWCILAAIHPLSFKNNSNRVSKYKQYESELNFDGIKFPVTLTDIPKFELQNNISINVYTLEKRFHNEKYIYDVSGPLFLTNQRKTIHINLLLIDDNHGNTHYCLIKDFSRLVRSQISKHNGKKFFCDGCLSYFCSKEKLDNHQQYDCNHIRVILPSKENHRIDRLGNVVPEYLLKFEDHYKKMEIPFVIYADFETLLSPVYTENQVLQNESEINQSYTTKINNHQSYSFAYYIKCRYNESLSKFKTYRGIDAAKIFVKNLEYDAKDLYNRHLKHVTKIDPISKEDMDKILESESCHICEKKFEMEDVVVKDHNHLNGCFTGLAHQNCNLNYKIPKFIPVVMHNLSGYDLHLFIKHLADIDGSIEVIAKNKESYISFSKTVLVDKIEKGNKQENVFFKIKFIDSFRFMPLSLEALAESLNNEQFVEVKKFFPNEHEFKLIKQKGVFPYSFVTSFEKLELTMLPSKEEFYNDLKGCSISDEEYERAIKVWETFNCRTLGDYSDIYLKSDVLILASVFENFRNVCHETYGLEPLFFVTSPGLSWSAMLKYTKVQLELLTDNEMVHFIKKGIRGGISQCSRRVLNANNQFCPDYDSSKPTSFIAYLDATNLYGAAMSFPMPTGNFRWLDSSEIENMDINNYTQDSSEGLILEIDLKYPVEIHERHNDLPFCPESMIPPNSKSKIPKLIPNLFDKTKYIIHYENLKLCLREGLKLKRIHRVLAFSQSPWLKKYIDLNTKMRNSSKNKFCKTFFKLMNNSIFGKTMENVEKYVDVKLVTHWENQGRRIGAASLISKPNFKDLTIFTENFVAVQMEKVSITYNKPIYIGFCTLEISKLILYSFYYEFMKKKYGDKVKLAYTDTDSLIIHIETENFYQDIINDIDKFDTSNYSKENRFGIPVTESIIGRMKDEFAGKIVLKFRGCGAKSYCVKTEDDLIKKAKGVSSNITKRNITEEDYDSVANSETPEIYRKMLTFKSEKHELYTQLVNKIALRAADDKRQIIENSTDTYAWGFRKS